jgi:integrase
MSPSSRIELQRTDDGLLVLLDGERERQEVVQRTLRGLGGLRFHDLRHTHATLLLQAEGFRSRPSARGWATPTRP